MGKSETNIISVRKQKKEKKRIIIGNTNANGTDHLYLFPQNIVNNVTILKTGEIVYHINDDYADKRASIFIQECIIIYFENNGCIEKIGSEYYNAMKQKIKFDMVYEKKWKNHAYYEKYTDEQYTTLNEIISKYVKLNNWTEKNIYRNNMKKSNDELQAFEGILSFSNYSKNNYDVSPAFDYTKIKKLL